MTNTLLLKAAPVAEAISKTIYDYCQTCTPRPPKLVAVLTTDNFASQTYVRRKMKACADVGILSEVLNLEKEPHEALFKTIVALNSDPDVDGILIQLPLRKDFDLNTILALVVPTKDVDGFHPINLGKLVTGESSGFVPCTPQGIVSLLKWYQIPIEGKHVVIVGRSVIVGRPLSLLLSQNKPEFNATVTMANSKTKNLQALTQSADIVIAACGSPRLLRKEHLSSKSIVIDVGINRDGDSICGDVHEECYPFVQAYSPVPGGVGPMTIASLLYNTALSHSRRYALPPPLLPPALMQ